MLWKFYKVYRLWSKWSNDIKEEVDKNIKNMEMKSESKSAQIPKTETAPQGDLIKIKSEQEQALEKALDNNPQGLGIGQIINEDNE